MVSATRVEKKIEPWNDAQATPYVRIERVTKKFGDYTAVNDVSLKIYKGEIFCLLGGSGCGKGAAKKTLDTIVASITASLKKNQRVQLVGFGSFEVTRRPARKGRNPRTGEAIRVKASKGVRFKAGQTLKRSV